jgi:hypothetical protein
MLDRWVYRLHFNCPTSSLGQTSQTGLVGGNGIMMTLESEVAENSRRFDCYSLATPSSRFLRLKHGVARGIKSEPTGTR